MCYLMFHQNKLCATTILNFYFRRLKRILPNYLLVLNVVVLLVFLFTTPLDYPYVIREIAPSALFYSNSPSAHLLSYFEAVNL